MTEQPGQVVQVDPRSERLHVGLEKDKIRAEVKTLQHELRVLTLREKVRKRFAPTGLRTQLEWLRPIGWQPDREPAPIFYTKTEEIKR